MGVGLSSMQRLTGTIIGSAAAVGTLASKAGAKEKDSGVDAKMAAKARKIAQQKINAIYANKEISEKARTRRMGKVIDEYSKVMGGNK